MYAVKEMKTRLLIIVGIITMITIPISTELWTEYGMVCNNAVVKHLQKYSNAFEDSISHYNYFINEVGYEFGVHPGNIKECVDFTFEQRALIKLENMTPICQNAISDWLDVAAKLDPVPQEILEKEKLFKQKNDATLAVLNHCDVETWTPHVIGDLKR
jgi:hypothetical protein